MRVEAKSRSSNRRQANNVFVVARQLGRALPVRPRLALVLGSGYRQVLEAMQVLMRLPYRALPGFPAVGVQGHSGELLCGRLGTTPVLVLSGRAHYYEGHSMEEITFPVRVLAECGVRSIVLTNAAGGINRSFRAGDFMQIEDQINFMGANPLRGPLAPGRERFVDATELYSARLGQLLRRAGRKAGARMHRGVYLAVSGPSYETPAEIRAFARLGADAVGMSTVPEAMVARQCGLEVAGLSCITNAAAGRGSAGLSHQDVIETMTAVQRVAGELLKNFAILYAQDES